MKKWLSIICVALILVGYTSAAFAGDDGVIRPDSDPNSPIVTPFGDDGVIRPD